MNVEFFSYSKRSNSTAFPVSGATNLSCQLKEETNIVNPTLIINNVPSGMNPVWNYAHIQVFRRYYFINNWRWLNGVWECECIVDVLASFKTEIGNLSEYVLRSSYESNGQVVDMQYPTTAETRVNAAMLTNRFQSAFPGGYYVLGIISNDGNSAQGAVTYYQMTPAQLAAFKAYIMSDDLLADQGLTVTTITDVIPSDLLKTLYNPFQYITSCVWMPFPASDIPAQLKTSAAVGFGWWTPVDMGTTITGYRLNSNGYVKTYSERVAISGHPQRHDRAESVFLDHSPFADRMLYYPPFGSIPINDDSIIGGDYIRIELTVDMILGDGVLSVYHDRPLDNQGNYNDMGLIARVSAPLAVPIQLAQMSIDIDGSIGAVGTLTAQGGIKAFIGNAMSGRGFLSTLWETGKATAESASAALGNVIDNPVGQLQTSGSNGSLAQYSTHPYFVQKWRIVADDDNAQKGRPLCKVKTLSSIPGFIMVDTPDVSIACLDNERQQIVSFLSSGFFYE